MLARLEAKGIVRRQQDGIRNVYSVALSAVVEVVRRGRASVRHLVLVAGFAGLLALPIRAVVGRQIFLGGVPFTVVGVAPQGFTGTSLYQPPEFYVPLAMLPVLHAQSRADALDRRDNRILRVVGRLATGVSLTQASQELELIAGTLGGEYPSTNARHGFLIRRERDARFAEYAPAAALGMMLIGLALAVLLAACANVAGLLTSRAPARAREIAIRLAIGGSRARLMRQLITEGLVIAGFGGAVGLALAYGGIRAFQQFQFANDSGVQFSFELDGRALVVGLAVAATSALLSTVIPAWRSTRPRDLSNTLRDTTNTSVRTMRLPANAATAAAALQPRICDAGCNARRAPPDQGATLGRSGAPGPQGDRSGSHWLRGSDAANRTLHWLRQRDEAGRFVARTARSGSNWRTLGSPFSNRTTGWVDRGCGTYLTFAERLHDVTGRRRD